MATVRISGNWRNPNKMEWGGVLAVDNAGRVERSVELPEGVYEAIERAIAGDHVEGTVQLSRDQRVQWFLDR
jgi:hypothetical protein